MGEGFAEPIRVSHNLVGFALEKIWLADILKLSKCNCAIEERQYLISEAFAWYTGPTVFRMMKWITQL